MRKKGQTQTHGHSKLGSGRDVSTLMEWRHYCNNLETLSLLLLLLFLMHSMGLGRGLASLIRGVCSV